MNPQECDKICEERAGNCMSDRMMYLEENITVFHLVSVSPLFNIAVTLFLSFWPSFLKTNLLHMCATAGKRPAQDN